MKVRYQNREYKLPDFLIVGAAKSGTTSLHNYLKEHPFIFMPEDKEPYFFSFRDESPAFQSPDPLLGVISNLTEYAQIFQDATESQLIGDASPSYLYTYEDTIKNVKEIYGDDYENLKIIIILRDPVSRAWSQYMHFKKYDNEPLDPAAAFSSSQIQMRMDQNWNIFYDYIGFSKYSQGVSGFKSAFPNVKVCLFDDLKKDTESLLKEVLSFLGVSDNVSAISIDKKHNVSGKPKNHFGNAVWQLMFRKNPVKTLASKLVPENVKKRVFSYVTPKILEKAEMPQQIRNDLNMLLAKDIEELERVINKDLSNWKNQ